MPAQLGVTDALFQSNAQLLGISLEGALAIAVSFHFTQLAWVGVGFLTPLLGSTPAPRAA